MEVKRIWASMKPRKVPLSAPMDEMKAKFIRSFKKNHYIFAREVSQELEIIHSKTICCKCMLFTNVCKKIGNLVKEYEDEVESEPFLRRNSR
ncbi:hypothetical protein M5D96_004974 [Drosophila gunungcola]|uniref:Uncharacterized protein n=1 Tax=Drosophila gunungcola TaxID=103775 RepID=A0A9Q0BTJ5_9MUSC|nr:hypothetical protein M5D96_004974 [Drosophila gunungcola]